MRSDSGGGPNSAKTIGFRARRQDGTHKRFDSQAKAREWAGESGTVRRITRNHNGTKVEAPID